MAKINKCAARYNGGADKTFGILNEKKIGKSLMCAAAIFGLLFCFSGIASAGDYPSQTGTVGYWKFNNESGVGESYSSPSTGDTVHDYSGLGNDGTTAGGMIYDPVSYIGGAFDYDGDNDYVNCNNDNSLDITSAITIEAWVYIEDSGRGTIASKYDIDTGKRSYLFMAYNNNIEFYLSSGTGSTTATQAITLNQWHHVAGVWDGSNMIVYVDGVGGTPVAFAGPIYSSDVNTYIGQLIYTGGSNWNFNGTIDEVRILNKSLTGSEVYQDYITSDPMGPPVASVPAFTTVGALILAAGVLVVGLVSIKKKRKAI